MTERPPSVSEKCAYTGEREMDSYRLISRAVLLK